MVYASFPENPFRKSNPKQVPWILPGTSTRTKDERITYKRSLLSSCKRSHDFPIARAYTEYLTQIDEDHVENVPLTDKELNSDGSLAIIAGSDTTSTTLSGLFYYILSNAVEYKRLQAEIDTAFPPGEGDPFDTTMLAEMPYLNAVM